MFKHEKPLLREVKVEKPNPQYGILMQEQLGGPNGELKAALQYLSQSFRIKDPAIHDLFLDIAAEELSHMEMVAQTINLLNGHEVDYNKTVADEIETHTLSGLAPALINSSGHPWTADYVNVTGDIAAEQRAKVVYEYLHRQINDKYVRETIDFLLNREEAHNALFREALNKVQDRASNRDFGVTKDSKLYFDLSTPGRYFDDPEPTPPSFENPRQTTKV